MTTRNIPDLPPSKATGAVAALQELIPALGAMGVLPHLDVGSPVATADASDLATSVALANALKAAWNTHCASTAQHASADATNVASSADATDLASVQTLLNELKGDFNAHVVSGTFHRGAADKIHSITSANATDQNTANTLANELKADFNAHTQAGAKTLAVVAS